MAFPQSFGNVLVSEGHKDNYNQATVVLHEACECGDTASVQKLLSGQTGGRAEINVLLPGHRAHRTALHKASSYGHTDVVKLLLKVGLGVKIEI